MTTVPHLGFIVAAYGLTAVLIGGTVATLWLDQRRQKRLLAQFGQREDRA